MKKVTFNDNVQVQVIPREPRRGTWVTDRCRFMQCVHELERLLKTRQTDPARQALKPNFKYVKQYGPTKFFCLNLLQICLVLSKQYGPANFKQICLKFKQINNGRD